MRTLKLKRVSETQDGMYGNLIDWNGEPFATIMEPNWMNNKEFVSCIPGGLYHCIRVNHPRFGETFQIIDVPDRLGVFFHRGNTEDDTEGCPLLGKMFGMVKDKWSVQLSNEAFNEFLKRMKGEDEFNLLIENPC